MPFVSNSPRLTPASSALALTDAPGALAEWPGAVIEVDRDGIVVGANDAGWQLADCLLTGADGPLRALISLAIEAQGATSEHIEAEIEGTPRWFDCIVLPGAENRTIILARDQTYDLNIRKALFESRQRYRDLVVISSDFAWETDAGGRFIFVSPHGALGYTAEELIGHHPAEFVLDDEVDSDLPFFCRAPVTSSQIWMRNADDVETCLVSSAVPVHSTDGVWLGARGLCRDITNERLRDAALAQAKVREQVVAYIVNQVRDEARPKVMLQSAVVMLGRAASAPAAVYNRTDSGDYEIMATYGDWPGDGFPQDALADLAKSFAPFECVYKGRRMLVCATRYRGADNGAVALARPVADKNWEIDDETMLSAVSGQLAIALRQFADQEQLELLSNTDALTGLMNRRAFHAGLHDAIERSRRNDSRGALVYVDLDNFKSINDTLGHETGDAVLCEVATMLQVRSRAYDMVARLGGDEFVIWFDDMDQDAAQQRVDELTADLGTLNRHSRPGMPELGASVGIAAFDPTSGEDRDQLISRADRAMYVIKHKNPAVGRGGEKGHG